MWTVRSPNAKDQEELLDEGCPAEYRMTHRSPVGGKVMPSDQRGWVMFRASHAARAVAVWLLATLVSCTLPATAVPTTQPLASVASGYVIGPVDVLERGGPL